jgi:hypothetical protein
MLHFSALLKRCPWACRICTLLALACLLTASWGAGPVLLSIVATEGQSAPEEVETHSDLRLHCPRLMRIRSAQIATLGPLPALSRLSSFPFDRTLPAPRISPCFIGSGIRLLC